MNRPTLPVLLLTFPLVAVGLFLGDAFGVRPSATAALSWSEGTLGLEPGEMMVQQGGTVTMTWTLGGSIGPGGGLSLRDPIFHGMRYSRYTDFTLDPSQCAQIGDGEFSGTIGLIHAEADSGRPLEITRTNDLSNAFVDVYTLFRAPLGLPANDRVVVYFGYTGDASDGVEHPECGMRAPWRAYKEISWEGSVTRRFGSPSIDLTPATLDILAGGEVARVWLSLPSRERIGAPMPIRIALLDRYGNPAEGYAGTLDLALTGAAGSLFPDSVTFGEGDGGVAEVTATFGALGVSRVVATLEDGSTWMSNPVVLEATAPDQRVYWGDIHSHHGLSTVEGGTVMDQNLRYAQEVIGLDFGGESMKALYGPIDGEELWTRIKASCVEETSDSFVPFLGFEWMGTFIGEGHLNVYYNRCAGDIAVADELTGLEEPGGLQDFVADSLASHPGLDAFIAPHATGYTGQSWDAPPGSMSTAEVYSTWGDSTGSFGDGRGVTEGIASGHVVGFFASSDNHDGFLGNPMADDLGTGGLAAVLAPALTRDDLFIALKNRRSYATSGEKILLKTWIEDEDERVEPGISYVAEDPWIQVEVYGVGTLDGIHLLGGYLGDPSTIADVDSLALPSHPYDSTWSIQLSDTPLLPVDAFYVVQIRQEDGELAWSTPFWTRSTGACEEEGVRDPLELCP